MLTQVMNNVDAIQEQQASAFTQEDQIQYGVDLIARMKDAYQYLLDAQGPSAPKGVELANARKILG
jgi:hypothetical protein